jgi:hypothetical protein
MAPICPTLISPEAIPLPGPYVCQRHLSGGLAVIPLLLAYIGFVASTLSPECRRTLRRGCGGSSWGGGRQERECGHEGFLSIERGEVTAGYRLECPEEGVGSGGRKKRRGRELTSKSEVPKSVVLQIWEGRPSDLAGLNPVVLQIWQVSGSDLEP